MLIWVKTAWTFVSGYLKYWKPILAGLVVLWAAVATVGYFNKSQAVGRYQVEAEYSQKQLESQAEAINQLTDLQDKISEQMIYRDTAKELFAEESNKLLGELDGLKETYKQYAMCSESSLPYTLDSMFDDSPGVYNPDEADSSSESVHESNP